MMSNRKLMNLAEKALFALGGVVRDLIIAKQAPDSESLTAALEEIIAKAQARMETFERVRHDGQTRAQVQRRQDRNRRPKKLKLGKASL